MEKQIKYSRQREELLGILSSVDTHPTADWLYAELRKVIPNISLGTVYRNLNLLNDAGVIRKIEVGTATDHFDANVDNHYHFVCNECGNIYDIHMDVMDTINIIVEDKFGHYVKKHSLLFYGICQKCKQKK